MFKQYIENSHRLIAQYVQNTSSSSQIFKLPGRIINDLDSKLDKIEAINFCHKLKGDRDMDKHAELTLDNDEPSTSKDVQIQTTNVNCKEISEHVLLRELLFVFQGIGGEGFKFNGDGRDFTVSQELLHCPTRHQHAAHLAELGVLHLKVVEMITSVPYVGAPMCVLALTMSMRRGLCEFSHFISFLEEQLADEKQTPTLIQFRVQTWPVMLGMLWLAIIADNCKGKKGGALLSVLDHLMNHGDHKVSSYIEQFYVEVAKVYYSMLGKWLKASEFYDLSCEFFITTASQNGNANFWKKDYYRLRVEHGELPAFISSHQAKQVLDAGWNVALLKKILGQNEIAINLDAIDSAIESATFTEVGHLAWRIDGCMHKCVQNLLHEASQQLVQAFLNQGKLQAHLKAITGHLLFRQDNFAREFVTRLGPILDHPACEVILHILRCELNNAIAYCNFSSVELNLEAILEIDLAQTCDSNSVGWDVFSLNYIISDEDPISLVLSRENIDMYQLSFTELLKTKHTQRILTNVLKTVKTKWKLLRSNKDTAAYTLRSLNLLATEMSKLMRHAHDFQHKCVEREWNNFQAQIKTEATVTNIIKSHEQFITSVVEHIRFDKNIHVREHLCAMQAMVVKLQEITVKLCIRDGELSQTRWKGSKMQSENYTSLKRVERKLTKLESIFYQWMVSFLSVLKRSSEDHLQQLSVHINCNNYYCEE